VVGCGIEYVTQVWDVSNIFLFIWRFVFIHFAATINPLRLISLTLHFCFATDDWCHLWLVFFCGDAHKGLLENVHFTCVVVCVCMWLLCTVCRYVRKGIGGFIGRSISRLTLSLSFSLSLCVNVCICVHVAVFLCMFKANLFTAKTNLSSFSLSYLYRRPSLCYLLRGYVVSVHQR